MTEVTYEMAIDPGFPVPGFLKRQAEKQIVKGALEDLKKRVESPLSMRIILFTGKGGVGKTTSRRRPRCGSLRAVARR